MGNGSEPSRIARAKQWIDEGTDLLKHLFEKLGELYEHAERFAIRTAVFIAGLVFLLMYLLSKFH